MAVLLGPIQLNSVCFGFYLGFLGFGFGHDRKNQTGALNEFQYDKPLVVGSRSTSTITTDCQVLVIQLYTEGWLLAGSRVCLFVRLSVCVCVCVENDLREIEPYVANTNGYGV